MRKGKKNIKFYSGLSGLQVPIPKYLYPEEYKDSSRLTYYSSFFNSIEINSTFYKLPKSTTIINWVAQVPEDFKFTFKLWKEITHVKGLEFKESDVEDFFNVVSNAGKKKGCILIQFPPSLGIAHKARLELLLKCIEKDNNTQQWKIAVEFRNNSWYEDDIYILLESYKASIVIQDIPKSRTPMIDHPGNFIYVRFHGPTGNYRESYQDSFLAEYATYIKEWLADGKEVYVYFNNTMGDAHKNLETLNRFVLTKA
jgi:uncharacterized protein YecE (DUF72 family)